MINSIHQSNLGTALRCGEQFRRRYIEGERIPPGVAAGRGTGVHNANDVNLSQKVLRITAERNNRHLVFEQCFSIET